MDRQAERISRLAFEVNTTDLMTAEISIRALGSALDKLARKSRKAELTPFRKNATRKLKNMMLSFSMNITKYAIQNTPLGDDSRIDPKKDYNYWELYDVRENKFGIEMTPGFHRGAWVYSESKIPAFDSTIYDETQVMRNVKADFMSNYKLGDTFYIAAKGPAYSLFESGVIDTPGGDGIVKPTMQQVLAVYRQDMLAAYSKR